MPLQLFCWFRHRWVTKRLVRRDGVRVVQRCRRCGKTRILRESPRGVITP